MWNTETTFSPHEIAEYTVRYILFSTVFGSSFEHKMLLRSLALGEDAADLKHRFDILFLMRTRLDLSE